MILFGPLGEIPLVEGSIQEMDQSQLLVHSWQDSVGVQAFVRLKHSPHESKTGPSHSEVTFEPNLRTYDHPKLRYGSHGSSNQLGQSFVKIDRYLIWAFLKEQHLCRGT